MSEGVAHLILSVRSDLHTLTAFDLTHLRVGLAAELDRYAIASALAEAMIRFAPPDPHPESFDLLRDALSVLEVAPAPALDALGLRMLWRLVTVLGFGPSLDTCARDGNPVQTEGPMMFSAGDGGALCPSCSGLPGAARLPAGDRADLAALVEPTADLPALDEAHSAAHRRLLARYVRHHLAEGATLPALEFWSTRPWVVA
jgi:recombinational DNA repair protein (RecF pathway)